ncbi:hypothetical protein FDECE_9315 [Fusarium decemcellulare]|nr:hypothetical protein FDECE_9315 [Fusarium decemcellulare]
MGSIVQPRESQLGFAGLGAMGFGMASNLLKAGFFVRGFDVNPTALKKFAELGGSVSSSIREASAGQSKFFVMVATPEQVDSLHTTTAIMIGGDDNTTQEIWPELEAISAPGRLFRVGPIGAASTLKMLNQHLAGTHIVVAAEALSFAKAMGLSSREAYKILMESDGASWIMGDRGLSMLNADWTPKSAVTIFTKDLRIVNEAADRLLLPCPIASAAFQSFAEREARGHGRDDDASVVCNYEELIGASVAERENGTSLLSPGNSPSKPTCPCILMVATDEAWADKLQKMVSSSKRGEKPMLKVLHAEGKELEKTLDSLPQDSLVGVTGFQQDAWAHLASQHSHLQFFDYQADVLAEEGRYKLFFTANSNRIPAVLELALGAQFDLTRVTGSLGAATAMFLTIRLARLIHVAAAAECYALAVAEGVSVDLVYELIAGAAGSSVQFAKVMPNMIQKDFAPNSELGIGTLGEALEDLSVLKTQSQRIKFPCRLLDAAHQVFKKVQRDMGSQQVSAAALTAFWVPEGSTNGSKVNGRHEAKI